MKPLFPAHRAAEEFNDALEGRAGTAVADRYADLLAVRAILVEAPEITPRPEFAADLRSRLMLAAETDLVAAAPVVRIDRTTTSPTRRRVGTAVAALVIVGGTAGMAAAASGALPGDSLYPIKRGSEQVGTVLHLGEAAKGTAVLGHAGTRLDEVSALLRDGKADSPLVARTVDAFRTEAADGSSRLFRAYQDRGNEADVATVRSFTAAQMQEIATLAPRADAATASALRDAADLLADIDQHARTLCGSCGSSDAVLPPATLASAAAASSVDNLISRPANRASLDEKAARAQALQDAAGLGELSKAAQQAAEDAQQATSDLGAVSADPTSPVGQVLLPKKPAGHSVSTDPAAVPTAVKDGVKGLVTGVTGAVDGATSQTPVGDATKGVTDGVKDGVKKATDGLGSTVDGVTGGLLN